MKLGRLNHVGVATPSIERNVVAGKGFINEVIMRCSTRRRVALGLRKLRDNVLENP